MSNQEYHIYLGVINFKIHLDNNRIVALQIANEIPERRTGIMGDTINRDTLKIALKYLFISQPEKFRDLYALLKENDKEMFQHAKEVVDSISNYCLSCLSTEK